MSLATDGAWHARGGRPRPGLVAENALDTGCMASPAVIDDDLVIRTKPHLSRIGAAEQ